MSAEELLRAGERSATHDAEGEIISHVTGKKFFSTKHKRMGSLGAVGLATILLVVIVAIVSTGNLVPAAILERLIEATDVQYADGVESKLLVLQEALNNGELPENTIKRMEANGITVEGSSLVYRGKSISSGELISAAHSDVMFYDALNKATYDRAAYYYDDAAEAVFKKIGTNRNNYTATSSFDTVMSGLVGEGSSINVNGVGEVEKENEKGEKYTVFEALFDAAGSSGGDAAGFIEGVAANNVAESGEDATLYAADMLNTADTISKEQKASIFFLALMENISKMKAGAGGSSKINEMMNYLYKKQESTVMDIETGEMVTMEGSAVESPSLYAILSGEKVKKDEVKNFASDRVLKALGTGAALEYREENVTSTNNKIKGTIARFMEPKGETADAGALAKVEPIINSSMMENGFSNIGGINAGEMLVEGAVNVGKELAKASGATPGDVAAAESYAGLNNTIVALEAEVDRINRSPFDISSPNTFLGSLVRKVGSFNLFKIMGTSVMADDKDTEYLSNYGDCERINAIGAVGTVACSEIATFDTSTLNDTFHDEGFVSFVEENTELSEDGTRSILEGSKLADFIKYNNERISPIGVMDGGILESIMNESSKIPFLSNVVTMIKTFLGAGDEEKAMAIGKVFVNSASNEDWETYKYAQRYVSLARATDMLRQYDGKETAYSNIRFFEGTESPVVAFLNEYYGNATHL